MNAYQVPADPTAVIGRRIGAWFIDLVIYLAIAFAVTATLGELKSEDIPAGLTDACDIVEQDDDIQFCFELDDTVYYSEANPLATTGLPVLAAILNHMVLAGIAGGSVGKLAVGLRIVKKDTGAIAGIGPNIVRTLLWIVDGIPYCFPLVGLVTGLTTKGHRRVGDMAASTLVVDKGSVGTPPMVPGLTAGAAAGYPPPPGGWAPPSSPQGWDAPPPPAPTWGTPTDAPPAAQPAPPTDPWAPPAPAPPAPEPSAEPAQSDPWSPSSWSPPPAPEAEPPPRAEREPDPPVWTPAPATVLQPEPSPQPEREPQPDTEPEPAPEQPSAEGQPSDEAQSQPGVGAPMWDAARNAYIQWDPALGAWMQWDDAAGQWRPIS